MNKVFLLFFFLLPTTCLFAQNKAHFPPITELRPSVVSVTSYDSSGAILTHGSGFFISKQADIMTLGSLLPSEAARSEITTVDGMKYHISQIAATDKKTGIVRATVENGPQSIKPLPYSTFSPQVGDAVLVISGDLAANQNIEGIVSSAEGQKASNTFRVAISLPLDSSGSPIFNSKGEVVGVMLSTSAGAQTINAQSLSGLAHIYPSGAGVQPTGLIREESPAGVRKKDNLLVGLAVTRVAPAYPKIAKMQRVEGTVIVELIVDENGDVTSARAISTDLHCLIEGKEVPPVAEEALKQAAVNAIQQWKFVPTTKDGNKIKIIGTITTNFHL